VYKENVVYAYNGIFLDLKKKEIQSFMAIWMNLEDIMLSEINQAHDLTYV
jgi:hypothetical protein